MRPFQKTRKIRTNAFLFICKILSRADLTRSDLQIPGGKDDGNPFWAEVVNVSMDQLMAPAVAHRLHQRTLTGQAPPLIQRYLDAMLRLNRSRNERLQHEAMEIAAILNEIDVVPVFLKGAAGLLTGLHDDPAVRVMSDLDVVVPAEFSNRCRKHLVARGYERAPTLPHPRQKGIDTYVRASSTAPIDLHHEVMEYRYQNLLSGSEIIGESVAHSRDGIRFAIPSPTHQIIINIGQSQLNDHAYWYGNLALRTIYDFACRTRVMHDQIDWQMIETRFAQMRFKTALNFHCHAARRMLGVETGGPVKPGLLVRFLYWRALFLIDYPALQRANYRIVRVFMLLRQELSSRETLVRLLRNMGDADWWHRHLEIFRKGIR